MRPYSIAAAFLAAAAALGQTVPGTQPLTLSGDPAVKMIAGISAYLERATEASAAGRHVDRETLRRIIGAVDTRVAFGAPELVATTISPAKLASSPSYSVFAVRWPVLEGVDAEGLLLEPAGKPAARVVVVPDADQDPEDMAEARVLAESGCQVLVPVIIDRQDTWSGNPNIRMTNQTHREFVYRMAFETGRHIIGYEVQKVLAAVDWFAKQQRAPIGVWGYGEGGLLALHAAAIDPRIDATVVSGYFGPREAVWKEPLYRNVWSLLKHFGDAEIARLVSPRMLVIETRPGPAISGPPVDAPPRGSGAAPGALSPATAEAIRSEFARARIRGDHMYISANGMPAFLAALGLKPRAATAAPLAIQARVDRAGRMRRQIQQLVNYTQMLVRRSETVRDATWKKAEGLTPERWEAAAREYRTRVWDEMIGRVPPPTEAMNPRTRLTYKGAKWDGYETTIDLFPDVFAYGVLLLPKDIRPGERRPVVVVQHGLEGRAQFMFGQPEVEVRGKEHTEFFYYQNIGSRLADLGFVVYSPQNPYIGEFRHLQRQANPLGLSLFSFILAQHERTLEWLATLPYVDAGRIGFYGLSYGGKTAIRVPPLLERYALSICSGDFNEWARKVTTVEKGYSYMFTHEWEIPEWNLAHIANHAELAKLMAPRPFMVERGHRDGVGDDEWVSYEYAKVRRFYDEMGIGSRTRIEYFNGPHKIHGRGTIEFLKEFLWNKQ